MIPQPDPNPLLEALAYGNPAVLQGGHQLRAERVVGDAVADAFLQSGTDRLSGASVEDRLELRGELAPKGVEQPISQTLSHCGHACLLLKLKFLTTEGVLPDDLISDLAFFLRRRTA